MKSLVRRYRWFMVALSISILLIIAREIAEGVLKPADTRAFTSADFDKIGCWMTEEEVIEALGPPVGDLARENYHPEMWQRALRPRPSELNLKEWVSETGVIWVYFDEEGKVASCSFGKPRPSKESFFQRLLKKLGLK